MKPWQKWIKYVDVPAAFIETVDFVLFGESDYIIFDNDLFFCPF